MSERKEKAHWVQNIMHDSRVMFTVNSKSFDGTGRIVDKDSEGKLVEEVSNLIHTKYGWSDGLIVELSIRESLASPKLRNGDSVCLLCSYIIARFISIVLQKVIQ